MKCPNCGSKNFYISEHYECYREATIKNNKLYKSYDFKPIKPMDIWLTCLECYIDEDEIDSFQWKCSEDFNILKNTKLVDINIEEDSMILYFDNDRTLTIMLSINIEETKIGPKAKLYCGYISRKK